MLRDRLSLRNAPFLWLGVLGLLWGANFLFMKISTASLVASQAVWLRLASGALALTPFLPAALRAARRSPRLALHVTVMTLAANVFTFHCFMEGTKRLDSGVAGVLSGSVPLLTAMLAAAFLPEERLTRARLAGLGVSFLGIVCIVAPWRGVAASTLAGAGYMLAGGMGYAAAFVYARRFLTQTGVPPLSLAALQMLLAAVLYAPLAQWEGMSRVAGSWQLLACVALGLGALGSGAAYVIYYGLIHAVGAVAASSVSYLPPLAALALGWAFLGEPVGWGQIGGGGLVLGGIYLVRRSVKNGTNNASGGARIIDRGEART
ncbi:DMT family transporter [Fundidesulfovibrio agrisoli]|uniref:DMT family transporter n=1 Tax=Fundidesulfovibrio agrisoli TaxID=2922717 RepID=UPI001FABB8F8|nr:DMT family transporter [Fundidesulfovibrio agrisoli]